MVLEKVFRFWGSVSTFWLGIPLIVVMASALVYLTTLNSYYDSYKW